MTNLTTQDKQFLRIHSISLDYSPVFNHNLVLADINGNLIDKMKLSPDSSWETFIQIKSMWEEVKHKYHKENQQ
ncbi:MAG: hypothetical protein ACTSU7_09305 [Candidatus Heimdallarchaeaceae archaeon]